MVFYATWRPNKGSQHEVKQPWNAPNTEAWLAPSIRGHAVVASHLVDHGMSETVKEIGQNHKVAIQAMVGG